MSQQPKSGASAPQLHIVPEDTEVSQPKKKLSPYVWKKLIGIIESVRKPDMLPAKVLLENKDLFDWALSEYHRELREKQEAKDRLAEELNATAALILSGVKNRHEQVDTEVGELVPEAEEKVESKIERVTVNMTEPVKPKLAVAQIVDRPKPGQMNLAVEVSAFKVGVERRFRCELPMFLFQNNWELVAATRKKLLEQITIVIGRKKAESNVVGEYYNKMQLFMGKLQSTIGAVNTVLMRLYGFEEPREAFASAGVIKNIGLMLTQSELAWIFDIPLNEKEQQAKDAEIAKRQAEESERQRAAAFIEAQKAEINARKNAEKHDRTLQIVVILQKVPHFRDLGNESTERIAQQIMKKYGEISSTTEMVKRKAIGTLEFATSELNRDVDNGLQKQFEAYAYAEAIGLTSKQLDTLLEEKLKQQAREAELSSSKAFANSSAGILKKVPSEAAAKREREAKKKPAKDKKGGKNKKK